MRLHLLNRLILAGVLLLGLGSMGAHAEALSFQGSFKQGGLIVAQSDKEIKRVKLGRVKVPVHSNGRVFVFGFGRDAAPSDTLEVEFTDGQIVTRQFAITQRDYKIDKIEGVAKKYVNPPETVLARIRNDGQIVAAARAKLSYRLDFTQTAIRPANGRLSGVYGSQRIFNGVPKRPHFGMDIAAPTGTPVIAPWAGKVVLAESDLYYSGGTLIIDHGLGVTSTYIHLSKLDVQVGEELRQGQKIAEIGATGRVTGPHLDWRLNWFKRRLDPQLLLEP